MDSRRDLQIAPVLTYPPASLVHADRSRVGLLGELQFEATQFGRTGIYPINFAYPGKPPAWR